MGRIVRRFLLSLSIEYYVFRMYCLFKLFEAVSRDDITLLDETYPLPQPGEDDV